jgi:hypothetical protein
VALISNARNTPNTSIWKLRQIEQPLRDPSLQVVDFNVRVTLEFPITDFEIIEGIMCICDFERHGNCQDQTTCNPGKYCGFIFHDL